MSEQNILIIGGGIAGAATAWHLAQRGAESVTLLERESSLGAHATSQNAAILRTFTGDLATTALAHETAELLSSPPDGFTEVSLLDPKGLILRLGPEDKEKFMAWRETKPKPELVRALEEGELSQRFPIYSGPTDNAWCVEDEGEIDVAALLEGYLRGARAGGVELRTDAGVESFLESEGRIIGVRLSSGEEIRAKQIAVSAGGWAGELAKMAGSKLHLQPRRRHLMVSSLNPEIDPRWPIFWSHPEGFYARPESGGMLMCACDESVIAPDECSVESGAVERIALKAAELIPAITESDCAHIWSGMRTFTEDDNFLIGPDPDVSGLHWIAALGGHGVTCSAGVGRLAAAHLLGDKPEDAVARALDPRRFAVTTTA
jgi:glycine/D-amino acid oxidase-like deaminating enzyme